MLESGRQFCSHSKSFASGIQELSQNSSGDTLMSVSGLGGRGEAGGTPKSQPGLWQENCASWHPPGTQPFPCPSSVCLCVFCVFVRACGCVHEKERERERPKSKTEQGKIPPAGRKGQIVPSERVQSALHRTSLPKRWVRLLNSPSTLSPGCSGNCSSAREENSQLDCIGLIQTERRKNN